MNFNYLECLPNFYLAANYPSFKPFSTATLVIFLGLLFLCLGWNIYHIFIKILGFIVGSAVGFFVSGLLAQLVNFGAKAAQVAALFSFLLGLLGLSFTKRLSKIALFLIGFFIGLWLAKLAVGNPSKIFSGEFNQILKSFSSIDTLSFLAALVGGLIFLFFEKFFIILATSAVGTTLILTYVDLPNGAFLILLALGLFIQLSFSRRAGYFQKKEF